ALPGTAAADTGTISFIGEITTAACAIGGGQDGAAMTVAMGSVPATMFAAVGDRGPQTEFVIKLIGCDTTIADTASISFRPAAGCVIFVCLIRLENGMGVQGVAGGLAMAACTGISVAYIARAQ